MNTIHSWRLRNQPSCIQTLPIFGISINAYIYIHKLLIWTSVYLWPNSYVCLFFLQIDRLPVFFLDFQKWQNQITSQKETRPRKPNWPLLGPKITRPHGTGNQNKNQDFVYCSLDHPVGWKVARLEKKLLHLPVATLMMGSERFFYQYDQVNHHSLEFQIILNRPNRKQPRGWVWWKIKSWGD